MFQFFRWRPRPVLWVSRDRETVIDTMPFLNQSSFRLLRAEPDQEALELARKEQPRLIIEEASEDPEIDAEFRRGLSSRSSTRGIPLILISPEGGDQEAGADGADATIFCPIDPAELFSVVQAFLPLPSRRTPRVEVNLRFRYRCGGATFQAFSRDLSEHGVFLHTDREFALGVRVELEFQLPGCAEPIRCAGFVRNTHGGLGIEFIELCPDGEKRLSYFVATHRADLWS